MIGSYGGYASPKPGGYYGYGAFPPAFGPAPGTLNT